MINFAKRISILAIRSSILSHFKNPIIFFCSQKTLSPKYTKIKETFTTNGKDSKEYQQVMSKAMREALDKFDNQQAINLEIFHLGLVKQSDGQSSEHYRNELREVVRFCINRQNFETAVKLTEQLKNIEQKINNLSPLDFISTNYLHGYILMQLQKFEESKESFKKCLTMKHVKQAEQVFYKIFCQLGRVHARCGEFNQLKEIIKKCQQIIKSRSIDPQAPSIMKVMDLNDIFSLTELVSMLNDKEGSEKYLKLYQKRLLKCSNMKDPIYLESIERKAKIYFNLKQYAKAVQLLRKGAKLSTQLAKQDPRFQQNTVVLNAIGDSIEKQFIK